VTPYSVPHLEQHEAPPGDVVDLEDPLPSPGAQLPCIAAIEFLADIYEADGGDDLTKAIEVQQHSVYPFMASLKLTLSFTSCEALEVPCARPRHHEKEVSQLYSLSEGFSSAIKLTCLLRQVLGV
jgi:hypothetical protein